MNEKEYKPKHMKNDIPKPDETCNRITIPITYPSERAKKTYRAVPSDLNVEYAKEWVDFNQK